MFNIKKGYYLWYKLLNNNKSNINKVITSIYNKSKYIDFLKYTKQHKKLL